MKRFIPFLAVVSLLTTSYADSPKGCVAIQPPQVKALPCVQFMWGETTAFWQNGTNLTVSWIGGTTRQRNEAWKRFETLDKLTGIKFTQTTGKAVVRVAFATSGNQSGHWSYVGRGVLNVTSGPTMNLALTAGMFGDGAQEWDRVALHEICHTLGMQHEHQHPQAGIPWDRQKVYAYYQSTQGWTRAQIDYQVLDRYKGTKFNGTAFDPTSLMEYPIDKTLTTNGFSVGWNSKLSPMDLSFLGQKYPTK